jgi:hypothetical protein
MNWKSIPALSLCFLLLASIPQSIVAASNSENISDDSQEQTVDLSEPINEIVELTDENVIPPTESELNGPDITMVDPPALENSPSMLPPDDNFTLENGPDVTETDPPIQENSTNIVVPPDDNSVLESGPDLTKDSAPSHDNSPGWIYARIYNADADPHYVYIYLDGSYKGSVYVPPYSTRYSSAWWVWFSWWYTVDIYWWDEGAWRHRSLTHWVWWWETKQYSFTLPYIEPVGYAYAKIYNADDDSHYAYIYLDGYYRGRVYVPAGSTRYSSAYKVSVGYHTMRIYWYEDDCGRGWLSKSRSEYVSPGEWQQYSFTLDRILPKGYAYAEIYNADDDPHYVYVYLDGVYKGYVYVPAGTTRYTLAYTVSVGYHTMEIKWYDYDDARWHESSLTHYVSCGEYQQYHFRLPLISPPRGYLRAKVYNADDDPHYVSVYVDGAYWTQIYASSGQTVTSAWREVSVGYHTVEIQWYDEDDESWHSESSEEYVSDDEYQEYYFELLLIVSYGEVVSSLPAQSPAFTETIADPSFAEGTTFTHTYDPTVNSLQVTAPDYLMEINYDDSMINLNTLTIAVSGYADPRLGENPPLISGSVYTYGERGLVLYEHYGRNPVTGERFEGTSVEIPIVGGGFTYATGDQGTTSARVETPVSDILGAYGFASRNDVNTVGGGLSGGIGIASVSGGLGGYWEEDAWGLKLNGDVEVDIAVARGGASGNLHVNLKPVADGLVAVGEYIVEGGKYVVGKIGDAIGAAADAVGDFIDGVGDWLGSIFSPIPPMPEDVRITLEKIRSEFTSELYEILTTTPVKARDQAADLMMQLKEIVKDEDIRGKLAQAISVVEQTGNDFANTWCVKSLSLFDEISEATSLMEEAIAQAEQKEPEILDNLRKIRGKLVDVVGLLAGDISYDAKVAEGRPEWIALADNAFLEGDYKAAYIYALISTDVTPPISSVDPISPYWQASIPFVITATATDVVDNFVFEELVASVELFYRYSIDNLTWSAWLEEATDTASPWEWRFTAPEGDGYYEFYTIAADVAGNVEQPPLIADTAVGVDTTPPISSVDPIEPYWQNAGMVPFEMTATASDPVPPSGAIPSGLKQVKLFYRYSLDNSTWGSWTSYGVDDVAPYSWSFDAPEGDGYYEFYSVATDVALNVEVSPEKADLNLGVDTTPPISSIDPIEPYWQNAGMVPFEVTATATDPIPLSGAIPSGMKQIELYYRYSLDNSAWGSWTSYDIDDEGADGWSWVFDPPLGDGYCEFYSITTDVALNVETPPEQADTNAGVDTIPPISSVDAMNYWQLSLPFEITASALDPIPPSGAVPSGLKHMELFYRHSLDNATWSDWTLFDADVESPWSWSFDAPDGYGFYEFYSIAIDVALNVEEPPEVADAAYCAVIPATIDIDPDTLNLKSQGRWITVYIELPPGYDVGEITISTVALEGEELMEVVLSAEPWPTGIGDHDDDGIPDLMVKFDRSAVQELVSVGDVELTVIGKWGLVPFRGSDTIRVIDLGVGPQGRGNRPEIPPGRSNEHPGQGQGPPSTLSKQGGQPPGQGKGGNQGQGKAKGKDK